MAVEKILFRDIFPASVDLSAKQFRAVVLNSSGKLALAGAGVRPYGILEDAPKADEGGTVALIGIAKIKAGAAITVGQEVEVGADGTAIPVSAGKSFGIARHTAAKDTIVDVRLLYI